MPSVGDQGQTGRDIPRPHALDTAAAAGPVRVTLHASPRYLTADDVTIQTYYYGHQSVLT